MVIRDNAQNARSIDDLKDSINQLFDETNATVLLSSVHKAKGSQANRVFLLQPELMPFWAAEFGPAWQMTQEWNIRYVALTRAKKAMFDIYDDRGTLA
jgi:superfamily I DNA/RNA helicase